MPVGRSTRLSFLDEHCYEKKSFLPGLLAHLWGAYTIPLFNIFVIFLVGN